MEDKRKKKLNKKILKTLSKFQTTVFLTRFLFSLVFVDWIVGDGGFSLSLVCSLIVTRNLFNVIHVYN